ncbi:MAG: hypothetical protein WAW86_02950 [Gammaproteobacteria bacterium]
MKATIASKLFLLVKVSVFTVLASLSFNALAGDIYLGNPSRPNTIWLPGHYSHGCWVEGYYVKYINPPVDCSHVVWVNGGTDKYGYYVPAHYEPRYTIIVGSY